MLAAGPDGLVAVLAGAVVGAGLFLLAVAVRGLPPARPGLAGRRRGSGCASWPACAA